MSTDVGLVGSGLRFFHTQITRRLQTREQGLSDQSLRRGPMWVRFPPPAPISAKISQRQPSRPAPTPLVLTLTLATARGQTSGGPEPVVIRSGSATLDATHDLLDLHRGHAGIERRAKHHAIGIGNLEHALVIRKSAS